MSYNVGDFLSGSWEKDRWVFTYNDSCPRGCCTREYTVEFLKPEVIEFCKDSICDLARVLKEAKI